MNSVGKPRVPNVPIISKPEELHAKGFISDAQLEAALSKDSKKIQEANRKALALYTLDDFCKQNPMTSGQTDTIKNAKGLSTNQGKANATLVKNLEENYDVISGLPGQKECMIISVLNLLTDGKKPDLAKLYEAHQQCAQVLKTTSISSLDGSDSEDSEDSETDSTEESDTIVASSDNDEDNIPLANYPKKSKTLSHAAEVEELLVKLLESKTFGSSDMYVKLYKPNLRGKHVTYTLGVQEDNKKEIVLIHNGDRFDAAIQRSITTTV